MDKYFIVLGASRDQIYLIKNIHKLNYKTIVFDKNKNSPGFKIANLSFAIDFKNYKKVIIKKLYTKQKNNNKYKKYINEGKKYKQSIEMYKEQIKYSQEQIKISKQLAEKEKDKLKRLEEAIKFV